MAGPAGAALTLAADIAARLPPSRPELKPGVVTAPVGVPFLIRPVWSLRRGDG